MPDQRGFGIFWVDPRRRWPPPTTWTGAFNRVALKLAPGADEREVVAALGTRLARTAGARHGRDDQPSHAMLDNEIKEQRVLGTVLPAIFLGVAAFLLNVVVSRLVATQREQIAALKALGYPNRAHRRALPEARARHRGVGLVLGMLLGDRLGTMLTGLYAEFFRFPASSTASSPAAGDELRITSPRRWPARSTPSWPPCG
jgi:putative ABC transport system permease protein